MIDWPLGKRSEQTHKKLPIQQPKTKSINKIKPNGKLNIYVLYHY